MVENVMQKLRRVGLRDVTLSIARMRHRCCETLRAYCELSRELFARKFGGIAISNARQLPGSCAAVTLKWTGFALKHHRAAQSRCPLINSPLPNLRLTTKNI